MNEDSRRAVFDCNIFVQALANEHSDAARALELFDDGTITLFVSDEVLDEIRDVLNRSYIRQLMPGITDQRVASLFRRLERKAIHIKNVPEEFRYDRDPKDERYINLALVANSKYLVSTDKDLLDLMNPMVDGSKSFFNRYPMLRILTASAFLDEVEKWRSEQ